MTHPAAGPVVVITTPTGQVAQRVDSYLQVLALAAALEIVVDAELFAQWGWIVVPDATVTDSSKVAAA